MTNLPRIQGMTAVGTPTETARYYDLNFASVGVSTQTGTTYTFRPTDSGGWVRFTSSSPVTATIAPFSSVEFGLGVVIWVEQAGTGLVTIAAGAGVTVYGVSSVPAQYSVLRIVNLAKNVWSVTEAGGGGSSSFVANVRQYGAVGNGTTDDTAAFQAAIATGMPVFVPGPASAVYKITATLTLAASQSIQGDGSYPTIKLVHATVGQFFTMAAESSIRGLTLDGSASGAASVQAIAGAQGVVIEDNRFLDDMATVATISTTSDSMQVRNNYSLRSSKSGVFLNGSGAFNNSVIGNTWEFENAAQGNFGCDVFGGAHDNLIAFNTKIKGLSEIVGVRYNSYGNRIIGNFVRDNGDNGISLSGYENVAVGNRCLDVAYGGIICYGAGNTVTGNTVVNAGQLGSADSGIVCETGFGGTAQFNVITGNFVDDDQSVQTMTYGVYMRNAVPYTIWAAGQTISAIGTFRTYLLNLYISTNTGVTGATPPTNTSGTQSDGTVIWQYVNTFVGACEARYNKVSGNSVRRAISGLYNDGPTGWQYNFLNDYQSGTEASGRPALTTGAAVPYTIATDLITITGAGWITVDTESAAASDDLATISGGVTGWIITVSTVSSSRDVTLKDNTSNLRLAGDCVLGTLTDRITLQYAGSFWVEISRSINT